MPGAAPELPILVLLPVVSEEVPLEEVPPAALEPLHVLLDELVPEELTPGEGVAGEVGPAAPVLLPAAPVALLPDAP